MYSPQFSFWFFGPQSLIAWGLSPFYVSRFLPSLVSACVCVVGGWCHSMTEMSAGVACPSSAFAPVFGASSSSFSRRQQTVGPLSTCHSGWATLPQFHPALDFYK